MKTLLIGSLIALITIASSQACEITLKSKTLTTTGAKIGDVSFSKKQIEALSSVCNVKRTTLSTEELIQLEEIAFQKRIAKLKAPKA